MLLCCDKEQEEEKERQTGEGGWGRRHLQCCVENRPSIGRSRRGEGRVGGGEWGSETGE